MAAHVGEETPFVAKDRSDEDLAKAYYSQHDLRDMYSRENTERRRTGGHTLRRFLSAAQDKKLTAQFVKIRDAYQVAHSDDVVIVFVQRLLEEGKEGEVDPELAAVARRAMVPERGQAARHDASEQLA